MDFANRRAAPRVDVDMNGVLYRRKGVDVQDMYTACSVQNISTGGACFFSEKELDEGDQFMLRLAVLGSETPLEVFGDVVWQRPASAEEYQHGARLYNKDGLPDEDLARFVANIIERNPESIQS